MRRSSKMGANNVTAAAIAKGDKRRKGRGRWFANGVLSRSRAALPATANLRFFHHNRNSRIGAESPPSLKKRNATAPATTISTHSTNSRVISIRDPLCDQSQPYLTLRPTTNGGLSAVITNARVARANVTFCGLFSFPTMSPRSGVGSEGEPVAVLGAAMPSVFRVLDAV